MALRDIVVPLDSDVAELEVSSGAAIDVEIRDLEFLGSYSWMKTSTPTIVVPGTPLISTLSASILLLFPN